MKQGKAAGEASSTAPGASTYLANRRAYTGTLERMRRRNRFLMLVTLSSSVVTGMAVHGLAKAETRPAAVPYVVMVDRLGQVRAVGPANELSAPGREVVRSAIRNAVTAIMLSIIGGVRPAAK